MSIDNNKLKDQLNILFDDLDEEPKPSETAPKKASGIVAAEKSPREDTVELNYIDLSEAESAVSTRSATAPGPAPAKPVPSPAPTETSGRNAGPRYLSSDDELVIPELDEDEESAYAERYGGTKAPSRNDVPTEAFFLDGDDYDEDADYDEAEEDEDMKKAPASPFKEVTRPEKRRESVSRPSSAEMRKETVRFWIFTAVIALIVAAAVILILYRRGFIDLGFGHTTGASTPHSSSQTTSEAATTAASTAAPSKESSTAPSTKATESTPVTTEPSSETTTESTEPSTESTSAGGASSSVLDN